ncbi:MAG TPA: glycerophosphodiester phosphodiesterase family protein [Burkholderiaceae bacterium]
MWPFPTIVAHRGGGTLAPENTLAAIRHGMALGFRAIEFDTMLARDGVPVLLHDLQLGRTVRGEGGPLDFDSSALRRMDAGSWFGPAYAGEPVPLLAEVLVFCRDHGVWMNVEIKPIPGYERETGRLVAGMVAAVYASELAVYEAALPAANLTAAARAAAYGGAERRFHGGEVRALAMSPAPVDLAPLLARLPVLSSFSHEALDAAALAAPLLPRGFLMDRLTTDWRARTEDLGAMAVHTNHKHLTPDAAAEIKAAGYGLFCYTVNEPARAAEILGWGVDGFCTDRLDLIGPDFPAGADGR